MNHPNAAAVREALEAFRRGDMTSVADHIAEDAVWHVPGTHRFAGTFEGREAILARFGEMATAGIGQTIEDIHDVVANDEHAVAMVTLRISSAGTEVSARSIQVYHVLEGKATEFFAINDTQAEIDALVGG